MTTCQNFQHEGLNINFCLYAGERLRHIPCRNCKKKKTKLGILFTLVTFVPLFAE